MKLYKNGYRSERQDSLATAVKLLTFIFGLRVVIVAVCAYAIFSGCGGGSDSSTPVYNENGVCVEKCGNGDGASDGIAYPPGDTCNGDTCVAKPDYIAPPCHVPTDPKIKKICTPASYKDAYCYKFDGFCEDGGIPCYETDGWNPIYCVSNKEDCSRNGYTSGKCSNYPISKECKSDKDCSVPCDSWPPEVCQGLPCQLVGKWFWASPSGGPVSCADFSNAKFYDNGDGYCRVDLYDNGGELYYKPGDDHLQGSPSGSAEEGYYLSEDGSQLKTSPDDTDPYERASEQTWQTWCQ